MIIFYGRDSNNVEDYNAPGYKNVALDSQQDVTVVDSFRDFDSYPDGSYYKIYA